ncbi:hypothetical protein [Chryseobacterium aquaticum]|uniref:hypothetical protein n=1 Tax=Chryseobacterium aquaticum TaxID=452084 RepID=UPI002FC81899
MSESFKIFPSKSKSVRYAEQTCKKITKKYNEYSFNFIINKVNNRVNDIEIFIIDPLTFNEFRKFQYDFYIDSNYSQDSTTLVVLDWEINGNDNIDQTDSSTNSNIDSDKIVFNDNLDWDQQSQEFWEQF